MPLWGNCSHQIIDRNVETLAVVGLLIEFSIKDSSAPEECLTSHTYKKTHFKRKACIDLECTLWNGVRGKYLEEFAWPSTIFSSFDGLRLPCKGFKLIVWGSKSKLLKKQVGFSTLLLLRHNYERDSKQPKNSICAVLFSFL